MTSIGSLRHRVTLEAPVDLPDGSGGNTRTWSAVATLSAAIRMSGGKEGLAYDGLQSRLTHEVVVRAQTGITPDRRFRFGARILAIRAVLNADARGTRLRCLCEEIDL